MTLHIRTIQFIKSQAIHYSILIHDPNIENKYLLGSLLECLKWLVDSNIDVTKFVEKNHLPSMKSQLRKTVWRLLGFSNVSLLEDAFP